MSAPARRRVYLLSSRDALAGLAPELRRRGWELRRLEVLRSHDVPLGPDVRRSLGRTAGFAALVTSPRAVGRWFRTWAGLSAGGPRPVVWTVGPESAKAMAGLRVRTRRVRRGFGTEALAAALGRAPRGAFVHFRSDLAGPGFARQLRRQGHRVVDLIAYRVQVRSAPVRRNAAGLERARALIATSPSALSSLRAGLGPRRRRALAAQVPVWVLGERTAGAARRAGFRRIVVVSSTDPQRLAQTLVRAEADARA